MKKSRGIEPDHHSIYAIEGQCMGVRCYRGFAPLSILSRMSQPDEYHQTKNPTGTQRDLNKKHAFAAYNYAKENKNNKDAIWPEVILNIRDNTVLKGVPLSLAKGSKDKTMWHTKITLYWDKIKEAEKGEKIVISRVDGNHRLYYANGDKKRKLGPLDDVYSSFCILRSVDVASERRIFRTINCEQKKLNVTHLLRLENQLTPENDLWYQNKALWLANKLGEDAQSPFYQNIHKGGKKDKGESYLINQKGIVDGLNQLIKNFPDYTRIEDYRKFKDIVRNYFCAVKDMWPQEWEDKKNYKLMTNTGMQSLGILGGKIMNLLLPKASMTIEDFKDKLICIKREKQDLWNNKGEFMEGKSGRPGAQKIANDLYDIIIGNNQPVEIKV